MNLEKEINVVLSYEGTKSKWRNNHSSDEWKMANRVGKVVGSPLNRSRNCQCVEDLYIVLKLLTRDKTKVKLKQQQIMSKFKLKPGKVLMLHGFTDVITTESLTDEVAIELLTKYPAMRGEFEECPDNWKALCEKGLPATPAPETVGPGPDKGGDQGGGDGKTREEILLETDVAVLRKLADDIATKKDIAKANRMCKAKGLTKYILENEEK